MRFFDMKHNSCFSRKNHPRSGSVTVLDLDGTLIDYWEMRREGATNLQAMLSQGLPVSLQPAVSEEWKQQIEQAGRLRLDTVFPGVESWLKNASQNSDLVLVTIRSHAENALRQLQELHLDQYFREIHVVPHQPSAAAAKHAAIRERQVDFWIGDTEIDHGAALLAGAQPIIVCSGNRNRSNLNEFGISPVETVLDVSPQLARSYP
jgi:phosphoglycolate phosphatase-like HAD superfamily hydrolase